MACSRASADSTSAWTGPPRIDQLGPRGSRSRDGARSGCLHAISLLALSRNGGAAARLRCRLAPGNATGPCHLPPTATGAALVPGPYAPLACGARIGRLGERDTVPAADRL